jgi:hypothetical protein
MLTYADVCWGLRLAQAVEQQQLQAMDSQMAVAVSALTYADVC